MNKLFPESILSCPAQLYSRILSKRHLLEPIISQTSSLILPELAESNLCSCCIHQIVCKTGCSLLLDQIKINKATVVRVHEGEKEEDTE